MKDKKKKKQTPIILASKKFKIISNTEKDMIELIEQEQVPELKQAYQEMLQGMRDNPDKWYWYTYWRFELKSDHTILGGACFKGAPQDLCEVEIGYGINEAYQRQGIGYEAVKMLTEWAFTEPNVYYILAETAPDNIKSQGLLEKLAFVKTERIGEEGPIYELEKPVADNYTFYICIGLGIGLSLGTSLFNNIALGIPFGVAIGAMLGYGVTQSDKKTRTDLIEKRSERSERSE